MTWLISEQPVDFDFFYEEETEGDLPVEPEEELEFINPSVEVIEADQIESYIKEETKEEPIEVITVLWPEEEIELVISPEVEALFQFIEEKKKENETYPSRPIFKPV